MNQFQTDEDPPEVEGYEMDEKGRARQLERLAEVKRSRSDGRRARDARRARQGRGAATTTT